MILQADPLQEKLDWLSRQVQRAGTSLARGHPGQRGVLLRQAQRELYAACSRHPLAEAEAGGARLRGFRQEVYRSLLRAERSLDRLQPQLLRRGWPERLGGNLLLRSRWMTVRIDPERGGRLLELSDKTAERNLLELTPAAAAEGGRTTALRPVGLAGETILSPDAQVQRFARGREPELSDLGTGRFAARVARRSGSPHAVLVREGRLRLEGGQRLRLTKTITLPARGSGVRFTYRLENLSARPMRFQFASGLSLNLKDAHVNRTGEVSGVRRFSVSDPAARLELALAFSRPARLWHFPLEAGSGLQRIYRGVRLTGTWPVRLAAGRSWQVQYALKVRMWDGEAGF